MATKGYSHGCAWVSLNNLWPSDISICQNICDYINFALFLIATLYSIIANGKAKHFPNRRENFPAHESFCRSLQLRNGQGLDSYFAVNK